MLRRFLSLALVWCVSFAYPIFGASLTHIDGLARTKLSLDGEWTISIEGKTQQIAVPANIPFVFGLSTWTKTFALPLDTPPATAYIQFDGIVNSGTVTLNGATLGAIYGFTETRFDVSGALNPDGLNTLQVTLDDRLDNDTVPGGNTVPLTAQIGNIAYTAPVAWSNRPGIIRSVSLVYSSQPVITDVYASQTFNVDMSNVDLAITLAVSGQLTLSTGIQAALSLHGAVIGSCSAPATAEGALTCKIPVKSPSLWSPENPNLYDLSVQLADSGLVLDSGSDKIGLRKFEARGSRFYLNAKPVFLKGITRHDRYGVNGFVADEQTIRQDVLQMKSLGLNFIRSIHYPPSEMLGRIADEYGILMSEELPAWAVFERPQVINVASQMLSSLISRDYNRASVVAFNLASYGTGNLPDTYLRNLMLIGKSFDPSRLYSFVRDDQTNTAAAVSANTVYAQSQHLDYYAQNTYWNSGIFDAVAPSLPDDMPFLVTEWTGSEGSDRGPIGSAATISFPGSVPEDPSYNEQYEAGKMQTSFMAFKNYLCSDSNRTRCIAGIVYFNWQDVEWPAMGVFYKNHLAWLRNGLVYEDRAAKTWPTGVFSQVLGLTPKQ